MKSSETDILEVLDACCDQFTFPMLDNGYVYLAATRLTLFRSPEDWALTIEIFGFSPRCGLPDLHIHSFGGNLRNRKRSEDYVDRKSYENYLVNNPHNESRFIYPIEDGSWYEEEHVANTASEIILRGAPMRLPQSDEWTKHKIDLAADDQIQIYELCRYIADVRRESVLATPEELRVNIPSELKQVLQLDEWHHPDVVDDSCRPSNSETFQQLAEVLVTGEINAYRPTQSPNTHWSNWPDGGTL